MVICLNFDFLNSVSCKQKQIDDEVIGQSPHSSIADIIELYDLLNLRGRYAPIFSMIQVHHLLIQTVIKTLLIARDG